VTEAGDGEDGRIKSAIGIGSLLADGIGDTIRVSLTEDAIYEIPVAQALAEPYNEHSDVAADGLAASPQAAAEADGLGVSPQAAAEPGGLGVSPQAVAGASRPNLVDLQSDAHKINPNWDQLTKNTSSFLPHWRIPGATYSVTFRLKDSLPKTLQLDYQEQKEILIKRLQEIESKAGSRSATEALSTIRGQISNLHETVMEDALNRGEGSCHLKNPEIATIVEGALKHFNGSRYDLLAWSVMPNHVHAVIRPADGHELNEILHAWKSFTAKKANELLGLKGAFWQEEYYDHLIRDGEDFKHQVKYVLLNPAKGSASGEWTGSKYGASWEEVIGARRSNNSLGQDAPATRSNNSLGQDASATRSNNGLEQDASATRSNNGLEQDASATRSNNDLEQDAPATLSNNSLGMEVPTTCAFAPSYDPFSYERRGSSVISIMSHELGGDRPVRVFTTQERWNALAHKIAGMGDFKPEIILEKSGVIAIDPRDEAATASLNTASEPKLITVADGLDLEVIHAFRELAFRVDPRHPILLKDTLHPPQGETDFLHALLPASQNIGSLLCDGIGDAILVRGETAPGQSLRLAYNILQAAGTRIFKTDYVACPSCGRTLFNLQHTTQKIREATGHLKGVRIAVMGCIVNGPGEMADADFGYVGGAPNKINLYVGKTAVKFNIPEAEAVERLIDLIREHGKWVDAPEPASVS
jgi:4-hydroxy-3-methylbut-2-en-1-yl diphosphate synthase IspG/GcpE